MVERLICYRSPSTTAAVDDIAAWLRARLDATVAVRDRFLDVHRTDDLAEQFAEARVPSPYERETGNTMLGTIRYEERALETPEREGGVLYDASRYSARSTPRSPPTSADSRRCTSRFSTAPSGRGAITTGAGTSA